MEINEIDMKKIFRILTLATAVFAVSCSGTKKFSKADLEIIRTNPDSLLHIYTIENPEELEVLRAPSWDLTEKAIQSDDYKLLAKRMLRTVMDTLNGGVGLAAPQIGINKAVIVVWRGDKPGMPYEVYPNIRIVADSDIIDVDTEGCLSIPGKKDFVDRYTGVEIEFYSLSQKKLIRDTIQHPYISRIFQHEIDHLGGILYTDRVW